MPPVHQKECLKETHSGPIQNQQYRNMYGLVAGNTSFFRPSLALLVGNSSLPPVIPMEVQFIELMSLDTSKGSHLFSASVFGG